MPSNFACGNVGKVYGPAQGLSGVSVEAVCAESLAISAQRISRLREVELGPQVGIRTRKLRRGGPFQDQKLPGEHYASCQSNPVLSNLLANPSLHAAMQRFLRFRTGCHGLPKDIGSQFGVPRHQRVCQLCGTGLGDEMHLVFECAAMTDLRGQFPDIFQPHQTMQQFMWQPNLLQVAKFLDAGMKRLQTVDPDEGSNI